MRGHGVHLPAVRKKECAAQRLHLLSDSARVCLHREWSLTRTNRLCLFVSYVQAGYASVTDVPSRGQKSIFPPHVEKNILKLVLACEDRGDQSAGDLRARCAVGCYIKGTSYEQEYRDKFPTSWDSKKQIVVPGWVKLYTTTTHSPFPLTHSPHTHTPPPPSTPPTPRTHSPALVSHTGEKWYDAFFQRMKRLPEYADIVETVSAKPMDITKLKYYTTENINKWYDEAIKVICDQWEIAERTNASEGKAEIRWTGEKIRILFSDESAFKDRKEAERIANAFKKRITR